MAGATKYPKSTTIVDLKIYPIKSCRGVSVKSSILTRKGLQYDRCCMFVNAESKFVTIREKAEMTLIKTAIDVDNKVLKLTFPAVVKDDSGQQKVNYESACAISVPLEPSEEWLEEHATLTNVEIWGQETDGYAFTSKEIADPVTKYFASWDPESQVRLVMKGPRARQCGGNADPSLLGRKEYVNFPDVLPIQVASLTSIDELNSRLREHGENEITVERFRPNVIVKSDNLIPWEEDEWKTLRINPPHSYLGSLQTMTGIYDESIDIDVVARCARCQVPNVDCDTAVKNKKEPWSVLYSYRRVDEGIKVKPCFGMLCCPRNEAPVEIGMEVQIREVMAAAGGKGEHKYIKGF